MGMGTGRKKIGMRKIENIKNRRVTFSKRHKGLFKKSQQLCTLTGCRVAVLAFSTSMRPHLYGTANHDDGLISFLEQAADAVFGNSNSNPSFGIQSSSEIPLLELCPSSGIPSHKESSVLEAAAGISNARILTGNNAVNVGDNLNLGDGENKLLTEEELLELMGPESYDEVEVDPGRCGMTCLMQMQNSSSNQNDSNASQIQNYQTAAYIDDEVGPATAECGFRTMTDQMRISNDDGYDIYALPQIISNNTPSCPPLQNYYYDDQSAAEYSYADDNYSCNYVPGDMMQFTSRDATSTYTSNSGLLNDEMSGLLFGSCDEFDGCSNEEEYLNQLILRKQKLQALRESMLLKSNTYSSSSDPQAPFQDMVSELISDEPLILQLPAGF